MDMGFNGARLHKKIFEERFFYHCDRRAIWYGENTQTGGWTILCQIFALCYTKLTDLEQEQNGLYTYDRRPKFNTQTLKGILSRSAAIEQE